MDFVHQANLGGILVGELLEIAPTRLSPTRSFWTGVSWAQIGEGLALLSVPRNIQPRRPATPLPSPAAPHTAASLPPPPRTTARGQGPGGPRSPWPPAGSGRATGEGLAPIQAHGLKNLAGWKKDAQVLHFQRYPQFRADTSEIWFGIRDYLWLFMILCFSKKRQ